MKPRPEYAAQDSAPDLLETRPEARAHKVEDLVRELQRGRIRIPAFQRALAWEREDARKLIDSLYRGYPVGTLLFWEREAPAGEVRLGSLKVEAPARTDAWWVVDGQQRLVSLARVLLQPSEAADPFALDFDLDAREVVTSRTASQRATDPSRWLPLNQVVDSESLFQWLIAQQPAEPRRQAAIQLGKRLREFDIPAYVVRSADDHVLREIFKRINSSGKPLKIDQVFDALNGDGSSTVPGTLATMATRLTALGFGHVDQGLLYRLMRVIQGQDVVESGRDQPQRLPPAEAAEAYAVTERAARLAVVFFMQDAGIPHYELLPYKEPLVTLGKFFHHHPDASTRSRQLLVRWLWRGALNGRHQGNTVSTRKALSLIDPNDEAGTIGRMLEWVGRERTGEPSVTENFNFRHAASKLQTLAMLELRPRRLTDGSPVGPLDVLEAADNDHGRKLPQIVTTSVAGRWRLSVVNRLAHPATAHLRQVLLATPDEAWLNSHGITADARAALERGDLETFFGLRASTLARHFETVYARHARWDESDRPALAVLLGEARDE